MIRKRKYCYRADRPSTPVLSWPDYISGMVDKTIRGNRLMRDYIRADGESDLREDLIQNCWLWITHARNFSCEPAYLKRVIINRLTNWKRDHLKEMSMTERIDPDTFYATAPDTSSSTDARLDVAGLIEKASLTDSQRVVLELIYGFNRGNTPMAEETVAVTLGKTRDWVRSRRRSAMTKLAVVAKWHRENHQNKP